MHSLLWALDITFSVALSAPCFKLHTLASKGKLLSCEKKKGALNPFHPSSHPTLFYFGHTEFRGFYTHFQCADTDIHTEGSLCECMCTYTDSLIWSPLFPQLPFGSTQTTPGMCKHNRRDPCTMWTYSVPTWCWQFAQNPATQKWCRICVCLCKFHFNNTDKHGDFNFFKSYSFLLVVMDTTSSLSLFSLSSYLTFLCWCPWWRPAISTQCMS